MIITTVTHCHSHSYQPIVYQSKPESAPEDCFIPLCIYIPILPQPVCTMPEALAKHHRNYHFTADRGQAGISLGMCQASERQRYIVTTSLIGWAHTETDPWTGIQDNVFRCHISPNMERCQESSANWYLIVAGDYKRCALCLLDGQGKDKLYQRIGNDITSFLHILINTKTLYQIIQMWSDQSHTTFLILTCHHNEMCMKVIKNTL